MPHRPTPQERCRSKRAFPKRKYALTALHQVLAGLNGRLGRNGKIPCAVYKCDVCKQWHLTSRPWASGKKAA